ncbi:hypothetical protein XA68_16108 [Ophiocordyceps unilateralis]|uniref:CBF1-interacting co-repressor CIR N-terminal domain-containing protein n=1 Tax=Ophiocordyceps unilateralis TaxID=268505 RepID=A0A2A9P692_OPHUN|nr:hypothetical protein XA68_16108 [Ophiocordyceps unilateralis]
MPLHLLGKKSWNVYNANNIARVRRDEAAAIASEEAEEQRTQQIDAERRLAILRGEAPPPLDFPNGDDEVGPHEHQSFDEDSSRRSDSGVRRKRKRQGEDDTDFELRLAREKNKERESRSNVLQRRDTSSAPIVDRAGHTDLFGDERSRAHAQNKAEAESESRRKEQEYKDQYRMRLSSAAGKAGLSKPWYSQLDGGSATMDAPSKDVWGNEDPRRKQREAQRLVKDDPLALMKEGTARTRELKAERKRLQEERDAQLKSLRRRHSSRERDRRGDGRRRSRSPRPRPRSPRRRNEYKTASRDGHEEDDRHKTTACTALSLSLALSRSLPRPTLVKRMPLSLPRQLVLSSLVLFLGDEPEGIVQMIRKTTFQAQSLAETEGFGNVALVTRSHGSWQKLNISECDLKGSDGAQIVIDQVTRSPDDISLESPAVDQV